MEIFNGVATLENSVMGKMEREKVKVATDFIFLGRLQIYSRHDDSHGIRRPRGRKTDNPAAAAKSLQQCPNLCDTPDGSPPGSPVPGILQARTLEWIDNPRQPIKKQRHHFADKCLYSQSYGFSSSHVRM